MGNVYTNKGHALAGLPKLVRWEARSWLGQHPGLYYPIYRHLGADPSLCVGSETDIVIEGYPRSANSFLVSAFLSCQHRPVQVAHHLHTPAQVLAGIRRNLPVIVLIRDPVDAIRSRAALTRQVDSAEGRRPEPVSLAALARDYLRFYQTVEPVLDSVLLVKFDQAISDAGQVIRNLNRRFGSDFEIFEHTDSNVDKVMDNQGYHAGPSAERNRMKARLADEVQQFCESGRLDRCRTVYDRILSGSGT